MTTTHMPHGGASSAGSDPGNMIRAGIDLGTTSIKMVVLDSAHTTIIRHQVDTPWQHGPQGTAQMSAEALLLALSDLMTRVAGDVTAAGLGQIDAIGIAGMGETGVVLDASGEALAPAMAWFDPRGASQVDAFPEKIKQEFSGRTGLPLGSQVSAAKIAYLRDQGITLAGTQWLNLPEFVAHSFGGDRAVEYSLMSRTGLVDQDSSAPWNAMVDTLGVDEHFFPPFRYAGELWGHMSDQFGPVFAGAAITVAGHDHLVAAHASGTLTDGSYFVSMGTAEVLLRVIDQPLGFSARERLAEALINEVHYVVPGKRVIVAGAKTGLILGRALSMVGISDRTGRDHIDRELDQVDWSHFVPPGNVVVSGARNNDGDLRVSHPLDDINPADFIAAVIAHTNDEIRVLLDALDTELPPATRTTLSGGWAGMRALQRARSALLPQVTPLADTQETAVGAALATHPAWSSGEFTTPPPAPTERQPTA